MKGAFVAAATAFLAAGCVTGDWRGATIDEPVPSERLDALRPGRDTLRECLASLGAPTFVQEHARRTDGSAGMVLVWTWSDAGGFGVNLSTGRDDAPVRLEYDQDGTDQPACVLWFDRDLVLERWRTGTTGELLPRRVRSAAPDPEP